MERYTMDRKIPLVDDRMVRKDPDGREWVLQDKWLRITQNPIAPNYPKTGDEIELKGHNLVPDGKYVVEMVTEFEPAFNRDADGRDIRITLLGMTHYGKDLNGVNIVRAMVMPKGAIPARFCWQRKDGWCRPFSRLFNRGE